MSKESKVPDNITDLVIRDAYGGEWVYKYRTFRANLNSQNYLDLRRIRWLNRQMRKIGKPTDLMRLMIDYLMKNKIKLEK